MTDIFELSHEDLMLFVKNFPIYQSLHISTANQIDKFRNSTSMYSPPFPVNNKSSFERKTFFVSKLIPEQLFRTPGVFSGYIDWKSPVRFFVSSKNLFNCDVCIASSYTQKDRKLNIFYVY